MKTYLYLLLCLLGMTVSANMNAGEAPAEFNGPTWWDYRDKTFSIKDKGTLLNPIVINTAEQLAQFSYLSSTEDYSDFKDKVIVLGADINLNKTVDGKRVQWVPIGYNKHFYGVFLGVNTSGMNQNNLSSLKRHTVSGMYIHVGADDAASISNQKTYGLFSATSGYIGHLNITNADVSVDFSKSSGTVLAGLLAGISMGRDEIVKESNVEGSKSITVHTVIDAVSVAGKLTISGKADNMNCVGGIIGFYNNPHFGFVHSSSQVSINATNCQYVGGIAAYSDIVGELDTHSINSTITDCTVEANITSVSNGMTKTSYAGGILGCENSQEYSISIFACSATGSIACSGSDDFRVGGISGNVKDDSVYGCASLVNLSGKGELGGIVGHMKETDNNSQVKYNSYGGHIDATQAKYAGGLCGYMEGQDNREYLNSCLFTGTMTYKAGSDNYSVTVGGCKNADNLTKNITYCYYDKTLFGGNIAPGKSSLTSFEVKGLTTEELTSANSGTLTYISSQDASAKYGFRLTKGYYPEVYFNTSQNQSNDFYYCQTADNGSDLGEMAKSLFTSGIYQDNTVYRTGTWICSIPFIIPKGDAAFDLVTHVIAPSRNAEWKEKDRTIKVNNTYAYQNTPCIKVSRDTAFVATNGTFMATLTAKVNRPTDVWNRPTPFNLSKQLCMVSTIDQEWDGSTATAFAAGTGKKEDPYLIKNGAQLAYAVKNNKEGECYKQMCDITLNKNLINYRVSYIQLNSNKRDWMDGITWNAQYDGDGHIIRGVKISKNKTGTFGNISTSGAIANLGVIDSYIRLHSGLLAYKMDGTIQNCIVQGLANPAHSLDEDSYLGYSGGICAIVGSTNKDALVKDCVSAMYCNCTLKDYTPFVSIPEEGATLKNLGKISNCLAVVPTSFGDKEFNDCYTVAEHVFIDNCYWLKGYEPTDTGYTLDEILSAYKNNNRWVCNKGYFPMIKSFAQTEIGKLMSIPVRTDDGYDDSSYNQFLLGFDRQLLFEPGLATWTTSSNYFIEADGDMGIIVPKKASLDYGTIPIQVNSRYVLGQEQIIATLGKETIAIPVRTRGGVVNPGITFVDENARQACLDAFDTDKNNVLSLTEIKAATNEQTLTAFQTPTAKNIVKFPEFRFFKNVTELTTQLKEMNKLEEIQLPYSLETIAGGESDEVSAFYGCDKLKTLTIPAKVKNVKGHPFYGSAVENIVVDPMNAYFVSRDGVLFDANNVLVAYPNGRTGEEIVFPGTISEIEKEAIYKENGLKRIYFETDDYKTVPVLNENGIVSSSNELIDVYVSDATRGSLLMQGYYEETSWDDYKDAGKLHCYYPLKVSDAKWATLYIGFDTRLPSSLTPYIVAAIDEVNHAATLRQMNRMVPQLSPILIQAKTPGTYRLTPIDEQLKPWNTYQNLLNGVGRDGMKINQGDSDRGGILTLGRHYEADGTSTLGFFYYTKDFLPPYRAYLTHNELVDANVHYLLSFDNDETDIVGIDKLTDTSSLNGNNSHTLYDLQGRHVSETNAKPGIYIKNGNKVWIK